jgi:hypothetical protein
MQECFGKARKTLSLRSQCIENPLSPQPYFVYLSMPITHQSYEEAYAMILLIILIVLIFGFGYGGYRVGPGWGYYGGGGVSLILTIVLILLLLRVIWRRRTIVALCQDKGHVGFAM